LRVTVEDEHVPMPASVPALAVTAGYTVTVSEAVPEHPLVTPVTIYVVVTGGLATGLAMVELLSPVPGAHEYVLAPLAWRLTDDPGQMVGFDGETVTMGFDPTVIITEAVPIQTPEIPVTEYVVVTVGLATGL
jgi:hypothetical protein